MKIKSWLFVVGSLLVTCSVVYAANSATFQIRRAMPVVAGAPAPADCDQMKLLHRDRISGRTTVEMLYVERAVLLDKNDLKTASVATSTASRQPVFAITFTDKGRRRFAEVTRRNINHRLGIIIDGQVYSAPVIRDEIPGRRAEITADFTQAEAEDLSKRINETLRH